LILTNFEQNIDLKAFNLSSSAIIVS